MINARYFAVDHTTVRQDRRDAVLLLSLHNGLAEHRIKVCDIRVDVRAGVRHLRFIYCNREMMDAAPPREVREYLRSATHLYGLETINGPEEVHEDFHGSPSDYAKYRAGRKSCRLICRPGGTESPVIDTETGMTAERVLGIFRSAGAILEGHFILASGRRSPVFVQKARVFQYPDLTELLCRELADRIRWKFGIPGAVVAPAAGGIVPGYETARHLGVPALWAEREQGRMLLKRFEAPPADEPAVVVEDVVTTGGSAKEVVDCLAALGVETAAVACLIDRSGGKAAAGAPLLSLAELDVPDYAPDNLPPELAAVPAVKPGSA